MLPHVTADKYGCRFHRNNHENCLPRGIFAGSYMDSTLPAKMQYANPSDQQISTNGAHT
jgi:hypothetical protein